jgi:hypothetical protein
MIYNFFISFFVIFFVRFTEGGKKAKAKVLKDDLPFISCDVCKRTIFQLNNQTRNLRESAAYKKLDEIKISELIDNICNPEDESGHWIRKIDVVLDGSTKLLELKDKEGISKCKEECVTISRSCETLVEDDVDRDELSALLWKNKLSIAELQVIYYNFYLYYYFDYIYHNI